MDSAIPPRTVPTAPGVTLTVGRYRRLHRGRRSPDLPTVPRRRTCRPTAHGWRSRIDDRASSRRLVSRSPRCEPGRHGIPHPDERARIAALSSLDGLRTEPACCYYRVLASDRNRQRPGYDAWCHERGRDERSRDPGTHQRRWSIPPAWSPDGSTDPVHVVSGTIAQLLATLPVTGGHTSLKLSEPAYAEVRRSMVARRDSSIAFDARSAVTTMIRRWASPYRGSG